MLIMLKEYRLGCNMTLEELAEVCDISWRNLYRIENGKYREAKFETIARILNALYVRDEDILKFIKEIDEN